MKVTAIIWLILTMGSSILHGSSDSTYLRVYFLYGSKPKKAFSSSEQNWFGGLLGGHVGLEIGEDSLLNFLPKGKLHLISKKKNPHGGFYIHDEESFWGLLGGQPGEVKRTIISVPISRRQKRRLDSIGRLYMQESPYDYAFIGMRCGSSTYEILAQLGILKEHSLWRTQWQIFYPRRLRKRMLKVALQEQWLVIQHRGVDSRKWERDLSLLRANPF